MDKEAANKRLSEISEQVETLLAEASSLTRAHGLTFRVRVEGTAYNQNMEVNQYGTFEAWETSNEWYDSGCGWEDSGC